MFPIVGVAVIISIMLTTGAIGFAIVAGLGSVNSATESSISGGCTLGKLVVGALLTALEG